jgi:endonuclease YncB( thermonuclease family)
MAAAKKEDYVRKGQMLEVTDGDTVKVCVDLGLDIRVNMTCRMTGINAPEKNTAAGKKAKAWMEQQLPPGTEVIVQTTKGDEKEKYGRYLVTIFDKDGKVNINQKAIDAGMAVAYDGGKRT